MGNQNYSCWWRDVCKTWLSRIEWVLGNGKKKLGFGKISVLVIYRLKWNFLDCTQHLRTKIKLLTNWGLDKDRE